jgi:hypothetical protein
VEYFRSHFEEHPRRAADRSFEDARGAYMLGHIAAENPNFREREFEEVEPELARGWAGQDTKLGAWESSRDYAREGFRRNRERRTKETLADQIAPHRPDERRE